MKITDVITSMLWLIFPEISRNIKFLENSQPYKYLRTAAVTGDLATLVNTQTHTETETDKTASRAKIPEQKLCSTRMSEQA